MSIRQKIAQFIAGEDYRVHSRQWLVDHVQDKIEDALDVIPHTRTDRATYHELLAFVKEGNRRGLQDPSPYPSGSVAYLLELLGWQTSGLRKLHASTSAMYDKLANDD